MPLFKNEQELINQGWKKQPDGRWAKTWPGPEGLVSTMKATFELKSPTKKRIRQSRKPLMNKLETEYHAVLCNKWLDIAAQAIRFRLGNGIWFKPDFVVFADGRILAYEVKGPHAFRGGFENLKVAASLYPMINWVLVWKENQQWQEQEVLP